MNILDLLQADFILQVRGLTPGRAATILPAILGLISVITGWLARARSSRWILAIVAMILALIDIVLSGMHLARATGGFGTGSGQLGAIVAMVLGLIGMVLGGLALVRAQRMATK